MNSNKGVLVVVSGPSGVGKGTVCAEVVRMRPDVFLSVSATSRLPRAGEQEGVHYFFKTPEQFSDMVARGEFLEYAHYVTSSYGTPKAPCMEHLEQGHSVILEIEVQGALQVKQSHPETVMVFVVPPSWVELEQRLKCRGTEEDTVIEQRLCRARAEFELLERYDYIVLNDTVACAAERISAIITAEQCKAKKHIKTIKKELGL